MKGMLAKPSDRGAAAKTIVEAAGGTLESYYATTGPTDFIMTISIDDVTSLIAGLMVAGGMGAISNVQTVRAFTADELTAIQKTASGLAQSYSPPN